MKHLFRFLAISIILSGIASCSGDDNTPTQTPTQTPNPAPTPNPVPAPTTTPAPQFVKFNVTLNGMSEVPQNGSTATGIAELVFNNASKSFIIKVSHSVAGANAAHINKGAVGGNGDIIFLLANNAYPYDDEYDYIDYELHQKYPYAYDYESPVLTAEQEADLRAGLYYVNINTATFPGGEIRGQLIISTYHD